MDDADADREFTDAEKRAYPPQRCPVCGEHTMDYGFVDVSSAGDSQRRYRRAPGGRCQNTLCAINGGPVGTLD